MLIACWSVKGGSGTSVVAAALALSIARRRPAALVDLGGDAPAVLGLPDPGTGDPTLASWADAPAQRDPWDAAVAVSPSLTLLPVPAGAAAGWEAATGERLAAALAGERPVVVDCGPALAPAGLAVAGVATVSLLVIRPCYLALRRAVSAPVRPSGLVVVDEAGRSLRPHDVAAVLGVPVRATLTWDPAVARAVDAGLLATRLPRTLARSLRGAA